MYYTANFMLHSFNLDTTIVHTYIHTHYKTFRYMYCVFLCLCHFGELICITTRDLLAL